MIGWKGGCPDTLETPLPCIRLVVYVLGVSVYKVSISLANVIEYKEYYEVNIHVYCIISSVVL